MNHEGTDMRVSQDRKTLNIIESLQLDFGPPNVINHSKSSNVHQVSKEESKNSLDRRMHIYKNAAGEAKSWLNQSYEEDPRSVPISSLNAKRDTSKAKGELPVGIDTDTSMSAQPSTSNNQGLRSSEISSKRNMILNVISANPVAKKREASEP